MLVSRNVLFFSEVKDLTIEEMKKNCMEHFYKCLYDWFLNNDLHAFNIKNYGVFDSKYSKKISFRIEDIIFESCYADTRENKKSFSSFLSNNNEMYVDVCQLNDESCIGYSKEDEDKYRLTYYYYGNGKNKDDGISIDGYKNKIDFFEHYIFDLFGSGEFPFISMKIVRISKQDYYFYNIIR